MKNLETIQIKKSMEKVSKKMKWIVAVVFTLSVILSSCSDDEVISPNVSASADAVFVNLFIENEQGQTPTSSNELIFATNGSVPMFDPTGNRQLILSDINAPVGTTSVECAEGGINIEVNLTEGAVPGGLYTAWLVVFHKDLPPHFDPLAELYGIDAIGAAGKADGSDNMVRAGANGELNLSTFINTPDDFGFFGSIYAGCPLEVEEEIHVVLAYHSDNKTYGTVPWDPTQPAKGIEHIAFIFPNTNNK